jgi:hypothetical protein
VRLADLDDPLPEELIAPEPAPERIAAFLSGIAQVLRTRRRYCSAQHPAATRAVFDATPTVIEVPPQDIEPTW